MKFNDVTRFEFRRFGDDFSVMRDRFAALGDGEKHPEQPRDLHRHAAQHQFQRQDPRRASSR